jgi:hypothetical protein
MVRSKAIDKPQSGQDKMRDILISSILYKVSQTCYDSRRVSTLIAIFETKVCIDSQVLLIDIPRKALIDGTLSLSWVSLTVY